MNKEDLLFCVEYDDSIDEQIRECESEFDIMEESICEQLGEEFENYKSVMEKYIDLIRFKCQSEALVSASRIFLKNKENQ